jgi:hypothetical protein
VELVSGDVDGGDLFVCDFDFLGVGGLVESGVDVQAGVGRGRGDQLDHDLVAGEWLAAPVEADEAEQPVLDLVPLRGAGREVADLERQAGVVSELL